MSRELRRVHKDWVHPKGEYLHDGFNLALKTWEINKELWGKGLELQYPSLVETKEVSSEFLSKYSFEEWNGDQPDQKNYIPDWPEEERTHCQMYETCSEGSPISPVMRSPEECAQWCADNGASAFGDQTASFEWWMDVCNDSAGFGIIMNLSTGETTLA